ncbi:MAG: hypothetical protein ACTSU6_04935 [Candidatus Njordarchaeales archaeon]
MHLAEGRPFIIIIVGRLLERDADGYLTHISCPYDPELYKKIQDMGYKIIMREGCSFLIEREIHLISIASRIYLAFSNDGIFVSTVIDLLYPFRKLDDHIIFIKETIEYVIETIKSLFPSKEIRIFDVQTFRYSINMFEIREVTEFLF